MRHHSLFLLLFAMYGSVRPVYARFSFPLRKDERASEGTPLHRQEFINETIAVQLELERRQFDNVGICGYYSGDVDHPRTAAPGFNCRVDTRLGVWGFCPQTVISASDCGLAASCEDAHDCSAGCGLTSSSGVTTFTW
jgi:hypothetical protein